MDKNFNAKQSSKKSQMAVEKTKKSASRKKKRSKKLLSSKSDQSPDSIEVEGVRVLDQTGADSDSSSNRQQAAGSPSGSRKSSVVPESESEPTIPAIKSPFSDNDQKPRSLRKLPEETPTDPVYLKPTHSSSYLNENGSRKASVSFSNFQEIQTVSSNFANMSVKSKNGSQRNKSKSTKSSSNGASKRERADKTRADPLKSCINKAAEEAAKKQSRESLRWELTLENTEEEEERIKIYKMNRRKRYLAAAQEKGLGWVVNYGKNGSPVAEEIVNPGTPPDRDTHVNVTDFSPVRSIMASQSSTPLSLGGEITC